MSTPQIDIAIPLSIAASAQDRADAGDRVSQLMGQPGWEDLLAGVAAFQAEVGEELTCIRPTQEGAQYADRVGEMRGAGKIKEIALGLILEGEKAAELVRLEEGF